MVDIYSVLIYREVNFNSVITIRILELKQRKLKKKKESSAFMKKQTVAHSFIKHLFTQYIQCSKHYTRCSRFGGDKVSANYSHSLVLKVLRCFKPEFQVHRKPT